MTTVRTIPRFRHRLSRLGLHFLFVALFAIIGGSLRGFNLLLVLAGLLFSALLIQWRVGRATIRQIRVRREPIVGAFAGQPVLFHYRIQNRSKWIPVWSLRIEDRVIEHRRDLTAPRSIRLGFNRPASLVGGIGHVPPSDVRQLSIQCRFRRRGQYHVGPVIGSTCFPFSLIHCEQLASHSTEPLYVYPRLIPIRDWTGLLPARRGGDGTRSAGGTDLDGDFFGLRPWQSGDHVKHIHWRTTARIGVPAVRQFEQRNQHQICIVVDGFDSTAGPISDAAPDDSTGFELVLAVATTLINQLATPSRSVHLIVADALQMDSIEPVQPLRSIGKQTNVLLERLAVARPVSNASTRLDPLFDSVATMGATLRSFDLLVISSRSFRHATGHFRHATGQPIGDPADPMQTKKRESANRFWRNFSHSIHSAWIDVHSPDVRRNLNLDPLRRQGSVRSNGHHHATR